MCKFLFRFKNHLHSRRDALSATQKFLDKIKFNSECQSIDDTIGYLIDNDIHVNYNFNLKEGKL